MERSHINALVKEGLAFFDRFAVQLPKFAHMAPADLLALEKTDVFRCRLGWDVTDYGQGRFDELGLLLFTARNGEAANLKRGRGVVYAEKIMISRKGQLSPMHRHYVKTEDIINKGGGRLVLELYSAGEDGAIDRTKPVHVSRDGVEACHDAGVRLALDPGESITLEPHIWHAFWAEEDDVLIGEVSTVNDDETDNWFAEPLGRFAAPHRQFQFNLEIRSGESINTNSAAAEHLAALLEKDCDDLQVGFAETAARDGLDAAVAYVADELVSYTDASRHLFLARMELTMAAARRPELSGVGELLSAAARRPIAFFLKLIADGRKDVPIETCAGLIDGISLMYATGQGPKPTTDQVASVFRSVL
eukprot:g2053.t1